MSYFIPNNFLYNFSLIKQSHAGIGHLAFNDFKGFLYKHPHSLYNFCINIKLSMSQFIQLLYNIDIKADSSSSKKHSLINEFLYNPEVLHG